jgi:hypothetical protein
MLKFRSARTPGIRTTTSLLPTVSSVHCVLPCLRHGQYFCKPIFSATSNANELPVFLISNSHSEFSASTIVRWVIRRFHYENFEISIVLITPNAFDFHQVFENRFSIELPKLARFRIQIRQLKQRLLVGVKQNIYQRTVQSFSMLCSSPISINIFLKIPTLESGIMGGQKPALQHILQTNPSQQGRFSSSTVPKRLECVSIKFDSWWNDWFDSSCAKSTVTDDTPVTLFPTPCPSTNNGETVINHRKFCLGTDKNE